VGEILEHLKTLCSDCVMTADDVPAIESELLKKLAGSLMQLGSTEYEEAIDQINNRSDRPVVDAKPNT